MRARLELAIGKVCAGMLTRASCAATPLSQKKSLAHVYVIHVVERISFVVLCQGTVDSEGHLFSASLMMLSCRMHLAHPCRRFPTHGQQSCLLRSSATNPLGTSRLGDWLRAWPVSCPKTVGILQFYFYDCVPPHKQTSIVSCHFKDIPLVLLRSSNDGLHLACSK